MKANVLARKKKKMIPRLCGLIFSLNLYGCNTMEGIGSDIKEAGEALENSAEKNKNESPQRCPYCCASLKKGGGYDQI